MDELLVETYPLTEKNTNDTRKRNISLKMNFSNNSNVKNEVDFCTNPVEEKEKKCNMQDTTEVHLLQNNQGSNTTFVKLYDDIDADVVKNNDHNRNIKTSDGGLVQNTSKFPSISINFLRGKRVSHSVQSDVSKISTQNLLDPYDPKKGISDATEGIYTRYKSHSENAELQEIVDDSKSLLPTKLIKPSVLEEIKPSRMMESMSFPTIKAEALPIPAVPKTHVQPISQAASSHLSTSMPPPGIQIPFVPDVSALPLGQIEVPASLSFLDISKPPPNVLSEQRFPEMFFSQPPPSWIVGSEPNSSYNGPYDSRNNLCDGDQLNAHFVNMINTEYNDGSSNVKNVKYDASSSVNTGNIIPEREWSSLKADHVKRDKALQNELKLNNEKLSWQRTQYYQEIINLHEKLIEVTQQGEEIIRLRRNHQTDALLRNIHIIKVEIRKKVKIAQEAIHMLSNIIGDADKLPQIFPLAILNIDENSADLDAYDGNKNKRKLHHKSAYKSDYSEEFEKQNDKNRSIRRGRGRNKRIYWHCSSDDTSSSDDNIDRRHSCEDSRHCRKRESDNNSRNENSKKSSKSKTQLNEFRNQEGCKSEVHYTKQTGHITSKEIRSNNKNDKLKNDKSTSRHRKNSKEYTRRQTNEKSNKERKSPKNEEFKVDQQESMKCENKLRTKSHSLKNLSENVEMKLSTHENDLNVDSLKNLKTQEKQTAKCLVNEDKLNDTSNKSSVPSVMPMQNIQKNKYVEKHNDKANRIIDIFAEDDLNSNDTNNEADDNGIFDKGIRSMSSSCGSANVLQDVGNEYKKSEIRENCLRHDLNYQENRSSSCSSIFDESKFLLKFEVPKFNKNVPSALNDLTSNISTEKLSEVAVEKIKENNDCNYAKNCISELNKLPCQSHSETKSILKSDISVKGTISTDNNNVVGKFSSNFDNMNKESCLNNFTSSSGLSDNVKEKHKQYFGMKSENNDCSKSFQSYRAELIELQNKTDVLVSNFDHEQTQQSNCVADDSVPSRNKSCDDQTKYQNHENIGNINIDVFHLNNKDMRHVSTSTNVVDVARDVSFKDDVNALITNDSIKNSSIEKHKAEHDVNYVFYDPEHHWCQICNVFPQTAKEYLQHLHSNEHKTVLKERKAVELPWHNNQITNPIIPFNPNAPTERIPIRGLSFLIPVSAWYCKLCDEWIGDLHCASIHLKSKSHRKKYCIYLEKNPNEEASWSASRMEAFSKYMNAKINMTSDQAENTIYNDLNDNSSHLMIKPQKEITKTPNNAQNEFNDKSNNCKEYNSERNIEGSDFNNQTHNQECSKKIIVIHESTNEIFKNKKYKFFDGGHIEKCEIPIKEFSSHKLKNDQKIATVFNTNINLKKKELDKILKNKEEIQSGIQSTKNGKNITKHDVSDMLGKNKYTDKDMKEYSKVKELPNNNHDDYKKSYKEELWEHKEFSSISLQESEKELQGLHKKTDQFKCVTKDIEPMNKKEKTAETSNDDGKSSEKNQKLIQYVTNNSIGYCPDKNISELKNKSHNYLSSLELGNVQHYNNTDINCGDDKLINEWNESVLKHSENEEFVDLKCKLKRKNEEKNIEEKQRNAENRKRHRQCSDNHETNISPALILAPVDKNEKLLQNNLINMKDNVNTNEKCISAFHSAETQIKEQNVDTDKIVPQKDVQITQCFADSRQTKEDSHKMLIKKKLPFIGKMPFKKKKLITPMDKSAPRIKIKELLTSSINGQVLKQHEQTVQNQETSLSSDKLEETEERKRDFQTALDLLFPNDMCNKNSNVINSTSVSNSTVTTTITTMANVVQTSVNNVTANVNNITTVNSDSCLQYNNTSAHASINPENSSKEAGRQGDVLQPQLPIISHNSSDFQYTYSASTQQTIPYSKQISHEHENISSSLTYSISTSSNNYLRNPQSNTSIGISNNCDLEHSLSTPLSADSLYQSSLLPSTTTELQLHQLPSYIAFNNTNVSLTPAHPVMNHLHNLVQSTASSSNCGQEHLSCMPSTLPHKGKIHHLPSYIAFSGDNLPVTSSDPVMSHLHNFVQQSGDMLIENKPFSKCTKFPMQISNEKSTSVPGFISHLNSVPTTHTQSMLDKITTLLKPVHVSSQSPITTNIRHNKSDFIVDAIVPSHSIQLNPPTVECLPICPENSSCTYPSTYVIGTTDVANDNIPCTGEREIKKKKKNAMSQRKRKRLQKVREKLVEQEKQLQEKIKETELQMYTDKNVLSCTPNDIVSPARINVSNIDHDEVQDMVMCDENDDKEFMLLGLSVEDSWCI